MGNQNSISIFVATAVGLGAIIGAGIFVLSGTAIALAGTGAIIAFILVGIVALFVALQLGELGSLLPKLKGASYSYVYKAFGSELGFITGIIMFFGYATAISAISLGFGSYLSTALGIGGAYPVYFAILLIIALAAINLGGIRRATKTDSVLVVIKVAILLAFVLFALSVISSKGLGSINLTNLPSQQGLGPIAEASVVIFFAYTGFQTISTFVYRIKGGVKSAVKALVLSVVISMVLYVLISFALIALVPPYQYTISADPLSFALQAVGAPQYVFILITLGALIATTSAALAMMLSASRVLYQISEDKLLPKIFRAYDPKKDVARNGIFISAIIAIVMLFSGNIYVIASISNFGSIFSYIMASLAVLHFRRVGLKAPFRIPFHPYMEVATIAGLFVFMYGMPKEALLVSLGMILALILIYFSLREIRNKKIIRVKLFS